MFQEELRQIFYFYYYCRTFYFLIICIDVFVLLIIYYYYFIYLLKSGLEHDDEIFLPTVYLKFASFIKLF